MGVPNHQGKRRFGVEPSAKRFNCSQTVCPILPPSGFSLCRTPLHGWFSKPVVRTMFSLVTLASSSGAYFVPAGSAGASLPQRLCTCVGWQVTLCDPIWQVTLRSFEIPRRAIHVFFNRKGAIPPFAKFHWSLFVGRGYEDVDAAVIPGDGSSKH